MRAALIALALLALAAPRPAVAAATVELKDHPQSHTAAVTLADLFDGGPEAVVVAPAAAMGGEAVLDATRIQRIAAKAGLNWANEHGLHRVIVASLGEAPAPSLRKSTAAPSKVHRPSTLVYARNIQAGEAIMAEDLMWSEDAVAGQGGLRDPDSALGKIARRALRAGAAATLSDMTSPRVVRRDETIMVAFESDGITLAMTGKAMADAAVGDEIAILNPDSKRTVQAVVSGPGRAVTGPAAEALKASFVNARQYASLP